MKRFLNIVRSEKAIIVVSFVFFVVMIAFCVFDVAWDTTHFYEYDKADIDNMKVELVNINTADEKTLCSLPGIGESTAKKIIQYRTENGPFETVEDIQNISGIGYSDYLSLLPLIAVE